MNLALERKNQFLRLLYLNTDYIQLFREFSIIKFFEFTQYNQINRSIHITFKLFAFTYIYNFSITSVYYLVIKSF